MKIVPSGFLGESLALLIGTDSIYIGPIILIVYLFLVLRFLSVYCSYTRSDHDALNLVLMCSPHNSQRTLDRRSNQFIFILWRF